MAAIRTAAGGSPVSISIRGAAAGRIALSSLPRAPSKVSCLVASSRTWVSASLSWTMSPVTCSETLSAGCARPVDRAATESAIAIAVRSGESSLLVARSELSRHTILTSSRRVRPLRRQGLPAPMVPQLGSVNSRAPRIWLYSALRGLHSCRRRGRLALWLTVRAMAA